MSLGTRTEYLVKTGMDYHTAQVLAQIIDPVTGGLVVTEADGTEHIISAADGKATLDGDPLSSGAGGINGPGAPTNLVFSNIGQTSATVSWTPPADVGTPAFNVYKVLVTLADGTFVSLSTTADATATFFDITGLTHDTNYVVYVFALRNQDLASSGRTSAPLTSDAAPPKAPPTSPNFSAGTNQVTLSWVDPVDWGNFQRVVARYSTSSYPATITDGIDGGYTTIGVQGLTIAGLSPATPYFVSLFASDNAETDVSARATVTATTAGLTLPDAPTQFNVYTDGSTSLALYADGAHGSNPPGSNGAIIVRVPGAVASAVKPTWDHVMGAITDADSGATVVGFVNYNNTQIINDPGPLAPSTEYTYSAWSYSNTNDLVSAASFDLTHTTTA